MQQCSEVGYNGQVCLKLWIHHCTGKRTKASCWETQVITIHQQLRKKLKERQCEDITQENILLVCQEFNTNPNFQLSVIISLWV